MVSEIPRERTAPPAASPPAGEEARTHSPAPRPSPVRFPPAPSADGAADAEVVRTILSGDRDAFGILVERHERKVFNLSRRVLACSRDEATDHSQEIFLRAYRGLSGFRGEAKFSTYLHRVALNYLVSEIRRRRAAKRGEALSLDAPVRWKGEEVRREIPDRSNDPVRGAANREAAEAARAAIERLDDELRALVVLREIEGRSYEEMAESFGIPIGTVRSRLHRAREILREDLRGHFG